MSTTAPTARDSKMGIQAFLVLDTFIRLLIWSGSFSITTLLFTWWHMWPQESILSPRFSVVWDWGQVFSTWILLYNVIYVAALVILRLPIPTPREGRYEMRPGARPDRQLLYSALIAVLTKARHDAPFPAFLVYHICNLPPMRWLVGPIIGPRSKSCNITSPTFVDPHMVEIGKNVVIGLGATIAGHYQDQAGVMFRKTIIEDNVLIGANSVMAGVHIQEGASIGAGAVVLPGTVVGRYEYWSGNPARRRKEMPPADPDRAANGNSPVD